MCELCTNTGTSAKFEPEQNYLCNRFLKSQNMLSEGHNLKIKSHFDCIKINICGDFPGCNNELLVIAPLYPLLNEHLEYLSNFFSFYVILEEFFLKVLVPSYIYQYAPFYLRFIFF